MDHFGNVGLHFGFGTTVLVGMATAEFSGAKTLLSIPLAALSVTLSALCGHQTDKYALLYRKRKISDTIDFLHIWFDVLAYLTSAATCARIASSTIDYMSEGRLREWLFGFQENPAEEPWPDVVGVGIIVVVTVLFMLGLEKSSTLSMLLLSAIVCGFTFMSIVGGTNTNTQFRKWNRDFKIHSWHSVISAAALCSFGFVNDFTFIRSQKTLKIVLITVTPVILYVVTSIILTLMSDYRELAGTAIPLIKVFELRDIGWARPFMAAFTLSVVCLALTEIIPSLFKLFLKLASKEWQIFVGSLMYRSTLTGAPILAIFASGSLAAILAFCCPLSYLIRLINISTLLKCSLKTTSDLYKRYKPHFAPNNKLEGGSSDVLYSKLNQEPKPKSKKHVKSVVKSFFNAKAGSSNTNKTKQKNSKAEDDNECLLMDSYYNYNQRININDDSDSSESHFCCDSGPGSDADESSSSTDIDAAVQEYIDNVEVTTVNSFHEKKTATKKTAKTVIFFIILIHLISIYSTISILFKQFYLLWATVIAIIIILIILSQVPQNNNEQNEDNFLPSWIFSTCAILAVFFNFTMASSIVNEIWLGIAFWVVAGLLLLYRCDCCTCDGLLQVPRNKINVVDGIIHQYSDKMDTILITR